jgi:hypothetical protein
MNVEEEEEEEEEEVDDGQITTSSLSLLNAQDGKPRAHVPSSFSGSMIG